MANEKQTDNDVDLTQESADDSELVKKLRGEIRNRNQELQSEREARMTTQKQATFRELGIDPNKGVGKLFFESYSGDLDAESVKQAAEEYELPIGQQQNQQQEQQNQQQAEEDQQREQQKREDVTSNSKIDEASAGAEPSDSKTDPTQEGFKAFEETMQTTGSRDNAMAAHFGAKLQSALKERRSG